MEWWLARPALAGATLYGLLSMLMFGAGLVPGRTLSSSDYLWSAAPWTATTPPGVRPLGSNSLLSDAVLQFQLFLQHSRAVLPHIPLWNPYLAGGRPFLADAQSAVFSLFSVPAYLLPFWKSLAVIAALKVFVGSFGAFLLGRGLGMRFPGSLMTGLVFGFGQFIILWIVWPQSSVWVLIPWMLLMTERVVRRPTVATTAGLALVIALQYLGGHPESSFHALFATAAFGVLRLFQTRPGRRRVATTAGWLVAAILVGTALAAITLVPLLESVLHSDLVRRRAAYVALGRVAAQPFKDLLTFFFPDFWGRATQNPDRYVYLQEIAHYAGALTLMLLAAALTLRRAWERLAIAVFGAFCLAMAVGLEPVYSLVSALPGFHTAKNDRMAVLTLLCVALLAGWGLDECVGPVPARRRRSSLTLLCVILWLLPPAVVALTSGLTLTHLPAAAGVATGLVHAGPSPRDPGYLTGVTRLGAVLEWLALAGAGATLLGLRLHHRLSPARFAVLALALVTVDLFKVELGFNPAIPIANAVQPATPAIRFLQARRPDRFVGAASSGFALDPLLPNVAMRYGLYDARAYDYPEESRYDLLWTRYLRSSFDGSPTGAPITAASLPVLRLLSVSDVVQSRSDPPLRIPGLRLVYDRHDARIYASSGALPRVFAVDRETVVPSPAQAMTAVATPGFNGRETVVTERRIPGLSTAPPGGADSPGSARLLSYGAERIVATTRLRRAALVVLTDDFYPGWEATVDGRAAPVLRVDYLLRGVRVPVGAHRVVFRYRPLSWTWGWVVSAVSLVALLTTLLLGRRGRARSPAAGSPIPLAPLGHDAGH